MLRVLPGDVATVARALFACPRGERADLLGALFAAAEAADAHRARTGRAHPLWGNGSLSDAAAGHRLAREPHLDLPDYAACMEMIFHRLARGAALDSRALATDIKGHVAASRFP